MTIKVGQAKFCTDIDSPEVILLFLMPVITLVLLNGEPISKYISLFYGIILGTSMYIIVSIVKNMVAKFMDSDAACRIPHLTIRVND
jgi:hypothetical protein